MARTAAALLLFLALPARAEVTITVVGERVSLRAVAAPLSSVLDQLARQTGMKVIYEGSQPRQPVTLTLESRTPVETVLAVLEGQGVNFGLRTSESGTRVDRLLLAGSGPAGAAPAPPPPKAATAAPPPVPDEVEFKQEAPEEEVAPPSQQPQPPQAQAPPPVMPQGPTYYNSPFAPKAPMPTPAQSPAAPPEKDEQR